MRRSTAGHMAPPARLAQGGQHGHPGPPHVATMHVATMDQGKKRDTGGGQPGLGSIGGLWLGREELLRTGLLRSRLGSGLGRLRVRFRLPLRAPAGVVWHTQAQGHVGVPQGFPEAIMVGALFDVSGGMVTSSCPRWRYHHRSGIISIMASSSWHHHHCGSFFFIIIIIIAMASSSSSSQCLHHHHHYRSAFIIIIIIIIVVPSSSSSSS